MSTTPHTPGRLHVRANGEANSFALLDDSGDWLLAIQHNGRQLEAAQLANLRRMAACWNACEGVPIDFLESWADPEVRAMFGPVKPLNEILRGWMEEATKRSQRAADAEAERDELLQVLRGVEKRCAPYGFVGMDGQYLKDVRAALAKYQPPAGQQPA